MGFNNTSQQLLNLTYPIGSVGEISKWVLAIKLMRSICVPFIVGSGLFGNILCFAVFMTKTMRKSSCSAFLLSLAFVDVSFLITLLLTWIDGDVMPIMKTDVACQFLIFATYISSFLNAWFIVGFTCERFIAICLPLKHAYLCNVFREKLVVTTLCVMGCVMYSFSFWTTGLIEWGPYQRCSHKVEYFDFLSVVTWVDTFLTMLIPFCIILCINSMVLKTVLHGFWATRYGVPVKLEQCEVENKLINNNNKKRQYVRISLQRSVNQLRVARTLFVVSLIFIILNLPSHAIRLFNLIDTTRSTTPTVTVEFYFFQECTLMLYYTTFSCNFILYALFGRNFKKSLMLLIRCKSASADHKEKMLKKLTSTQGVCVSSC